MADLKRFFKKTVSEDRHKQAASVSVPEGLWIKCPKCGEMVYREDVISNAYVCPKCGGYFRISAKRRIKMIADKGSFKEWFYRNCNFYKRGCEKTRLSFFASPFLYLLCIND